MTKFSYLVEIFEVGDTVLIETNDILIKEAKVIHCYTSYNDSMIIVEFGDNQSMDINIDDIIRVER